MIGKNIQNHFIIAFIILLASYFIIFAYLRWIANFDFIYSDAQGYWEDSLILSSPFHRFHVPGYPFLIAAFRTFTLDLLSPLVVMGAITFTSYFISIFLIYIFLTNAGFSDYISAFGPLLFGLFPFVGIPYAVYPVADLVAMMWFLGGLVAFQKHKHLLAALLWGLAIVTHKALWPFVGLTLISQFVFNRKEVQQPIKWFLITIIAFLPIALVWLFGSHYHSSFLWIISSNLKTEMVSWGTLPNLNGIIDILFHGGIINFSKSAIMSILLILSVSLFVLCWRSVVPECRIYGLPIAISVILLCLILSQHEIWAAMRFGRLLVIPLLLSFGFWLQNSDLLNSNLGKVIVSISGVFLFLTNLLYAWYMVAIFWG